MVSPWISLCVLETLCIFFSMTVAAFRALSDTSPCFPGTHFSARSFACYLLGNINLPNHVLYAHGFIRRIEEQGINDGCSIDVMSSLVPASYQCGFLHPLMERYPVGHQRREVPPEHRYALYDKRCCIELILKLHHCIIALSTLF